MCGGGGGLQGGNSSRGGCLRSRHAIVPGLAADQLFSLAAVRVGGGNLAPSNGKLDG